MPPPRTFRRALVCALVLLTLPPAAYFSARAEQLPLKYFTTADGLPYDIIARVTQDSRGLIWVCTSNGLARFDGARFITYRDADGLMSQVNHLLETRDHTLWVSTNGGGVYRIEERGAQASAPAAGAAPPAARAGITFVNYAVGDDPATMRVNLLYEDARGRLWAGTDAGLFVLERGGEKFERFSMGFPESQERITQVWDFVEDGAGALWVGTKFGLVRILPEGHVRRHPVLPATAGRDVILSLLRDRDGRIWAGHEGGLLVFVPDSAGADASPPWKELRRGGAATQNGSGLLPAAPGEARLFGEADGLKPGRVKSLAQTADGHVWAGTLAALSEFDGHTFRNYTEAEGLRGGEVNSSFMARDGSLWLGTNGAGLVRLSKSGFTVFRAADGLGHPRPLSLFEDPEGNFYSADQTGRVNLFDPATSRFVSARLNLPAVVFATGWNSARRIIRARDGEWWAATAHGLFRFARVERIERLAAARPVVHYTTRDGLAYDDTVSLFEDSRGDIWFSTFAAQRVVVTRWERATETFHNYSDADGLPSFNSAFSFCEDAGGRVWVGFREGGVARYAGGRFTTLTKEDGLGASQVTALLAARDGRVWVATLDGLGRIDDPGAERPRVRMYTAADGLVSNNTFTLAEDARGRVYVGAANLLDRLDPETGHVEHFDRGDGLTGSIMHTSFRDRSGALWFGAADGLLRYVPRPDARRTPPAVYVSGLRVAGSPVPVPELGVTSLPALELSPDQNHVQVDFYGLAHDLSGVRTQYKLEGSEQDWSAPSDERTITFAKLAPGAYRLLVRAVTPDGLVSAEPAAVSFTVLRPVWQRPWFVTLAVLAAAALGHSVYRYRVAQLLKVERVRTRIATDLHDDIGASLSRMAILSEVVKQQTAGGGNGHTSQSAALLTEIAESARGLVDSMSDIVWSIDPRRDDLRSVVQRVRQFASDVLEPKGIGWDFIVTPEVEALKLDPDARRHLFLIYKEAVNNVARHAGDARQVSLTLRCEGRTLVGEVRDDGRGFAPTPDGAAPAHGTRGGNGLPNMRARAAEIGGRLEVESAPREGTRLRFVVPTK